MTPHEYIFVGIIVSLFTGLIGVSIGRKGRVTEDACEERRGSCNKILCNELTHIKNEQVEMKKDIKIILKHIKVH